MNEIDALLDPKSNESNLLSGDVPAQMFQTGPTGRTPLVLSESGANQDQVQVCLMRNELVGKTDFEKMYFNGVVNRL